MSVKILKMRNGAEVYEVTGLDLEMLSEEEIAALEEPWYDEEALREVINLSDLPLGRWRSRGNG